MRVSTATVWIAITHHGQMTAAQQAGGAGSRLDADVDRIDVCRVA